MGRAGGHDSDGEPPIGSFVGLAPLAVPLPFADAAAAQPINPDRTTIGVDMVRFVGRSKRTSTSGRPATTQRAYPPCQLDTSLREPLSRTSTKPKQTEPNRCHKIAPIHTRAHPGGNLRLLLAFLLLDHGSFSCCWFTLRLSARSCWSKNEGCDKMTMESLVLRKGLVFPCVYRDF